MGATATTERRTTPSPGESVEELMALRQRVRAAWRPNLDADTATRLRALEVGVAEAMEEASIEAQRAERRSAENAAAAERTRLWFVHPGGHFGACSDTRSMMLPEAQLRSVAGSGVWHLDPSQQRPDWWPAPVLADVPSAG